MVAIASHTCYLCVVKDGTVCGQGCHLLVFSRMTCCSFVQCMDSYVMDWLMWHVDTFACHDFDDALCFCRTFTMVSTGPWTSSLQRFHPIFSPVQYDIYDREFRDVCCGAAGLCNLFLSHRPRASCFFYFPPFRGMVLIALIRVLQCIQSPCMHDVYHWYFGQP